MSSVSNSLYFLTLRLVSVMHIIYRKIRHARYLYIKRNVEKAWDARYLSKNTVIYYVIKVKVKFTLEQATKVQRGSRGTALLFL